MLAVKVLLWLNPQNKTANLDFVIGRDLRALLSWQFMAVDERWVSSLGREPELAVVVARECGVYAADFRVAFERQVNGDGARAAPDGDFRFRDWNDRLTNACAPDLYVKENGHARAHNG